MLWWGYLLTVLVFLHRDRIQKLYGSDISLEANELAVSNLKLLTTDDKKQKINNSNYTRVKKLQIGKRKIEFLMKL